MSDYFEQMIYDDGTYQVLQCQKRGYAPYFELHEPLKLFGKSFRGEGLFHSTLLVWSTDQSEIKARLKKFKEFPSPVVKFELDD